ncbi:MAG: hypothetical protein Q7J47_01550 [Azoarcus sp.]|nr:hypothetical protein [Azoarcus sp.]
MSEHIQHWKTEHANYRKLLDLVETLAQHFPAFHHQIASQAECGCTEPVGPGGCSD